MTTLKLNDEQKTLLSELKKLLDFGYDKFSKKEYSMKMRPRKTILFSMMGAMHNYAEGIHYLLLEARTNSAEVLFRPMLETLINLAYVYVGRNESKAVIFLLDDLYDKKKTAGKFRRFIKAHPRFKTSFGKMESAEDWDNFISDREKEIEKITKHYRYATRGLPNLRQRAEIYDKSREPKYKRELKNRLEWWYLTAYWYFSNLTHLGPTGLDSFFSKNPNGQLFVDVSGKPEDIKRIAIITYATYYQFLWSFNKNFKVVNSEELKEFKNKLFTLSKN